jgi:hypothetical protein
MTKQELIQRRYEYLIQQGVCPDDAELLAEIQITGELNVITTRTDPRPESPSE